MPRKPNPELIDDDAPEATDEWFKKARPARDELPGLVGANAAKELLKPKYPRANGNTLRGKWLGTGAVRKAKQYCQAGKA